ARHLDEMLVRVVVRLDGRGGARVDDALGSQLDSAKLDPVPAPEGGPPAAFVQAVELALRTAEQEAQQRLEDLIAVATRRVAHEKEAAVRRVGRWLSQSKVKAADASKVLAAEAAVYDAAAAALAEARLELDQASLIQLA
ncbi:MAG: hypothetical protein ACXWLM_02045, partial [Myxococcales bacterium]